MSGMGVAAGGGQTQEPHLEHGVGEEGLQHAALTGSVGLVLLQQLVKVAVLLAVGQHLQAVLVVPHKLLVDVQHRQQDVKQVSCRGRGTVHTRLQQKALQRSTSNFTNL